MAMSVPTPALDMLLGQGPAASLAEGGMGSPTECASASCRCPFADIDPAEAHETYNDPAEATYTCMLLDRDVWGEAPACTLALWQAEARRELRKEKGENDG